MSNTRWMHVKTGGHYTEGARGLLKVEEGHEDWQEAVIYRSDDGRWFVRPAAKFDDGRFQQVSTPAGAQEAPKFCPCGTFYCPGGEWKEAPAGQPALASPADAAQRVPLTHEQIDAAFNRARKFGQHLTTYEAARAIEAAHGITSEPPMEHD